MTALVVLAGAAQVVTAAWAFNLWLMLLSNILGDAARVAGRRHPLGRWAGLPARIHAELHPFAWPGMAYGVAWGAATHHRYTFLSCGVGLFCWWVSRNWPDDDDRWRRRRRRLLARVQQLGSRLVITPETA